MWGKCGPHETILHSVSGNFITDGNQLLQSENGFVYLCRTLLQTLFNYSPYAAIMFFFYAWECIQLYNVAGLCWSPRLVVQMACEVNALLHALGIVGGVFAHFLMKQYGFCRVLHEERISNEPLFGTRFIRYGFTGSWRQAQLSALFLVLQPVFATPVFGDVVGHGARHKHMLDTFGFAMWWDEMFLFSQEDQKCGLQSPTFFNMVKYKFDKCCPLLRELKWRDVVLFRHKLLVTLGHFNSKVFA